MYLVELKPGKEELYRTGDDLAIAIRDGEVDARSRVYHRATAKWISITLHPQYKAIVAGLEEPTQPGRKAWGLLPVGLSTVPVELAPAETPAVNGGIRQRWKKPMGLGLAGMLLLLGFQLAFSGPRPPWAGQGKAVALETGQAKRLERKQRIQVVEDSRAPRRNAIDMVSLASSTTIWPESSSERGDTVAAPVTAAPALPRAPRLRLRALRAALTAEKSTAPVAGAPSTQPLISRYEAASHDAYSRLEAGIRVARLDRLFASGRLTPGGGVTETRLGLAGAANFMRVYRQQQAEIDRAYQDTMLVLSKQDGWSPKEVKQWYSRQQWKENPALELLSSALLAGIDSILGVLDDEAGAYKVRGTAIAFEDPAATVAYGSLRRRIKEQIEAAVAADGATSLGPTGLLLRAIGTSTLPRET